MVEAAQDQGARTVDAAGAAERPPEQPQRTWRWATPEEERAVRRAVIDFHVVEPHHGEIDRRLQNWARWCRGASAPKASPMFRMAPPPPRVRGELAYQGAGAIDRMDAQLIAKLVAGLPLHHRAAINWHYVKPVSPKRACATIGCTMDGLAKLVRDGRQMLMNRTP